MRRFAFSCVLALVLVLAASGAWCASLDAAIGDLPAKEQEKVKAAVATFLRAKVKGDRSSNDLGWDCQAAIALSELGVAGAKERLADIAGELKNDAHRSKRGGKVVGWSATGEKFSGCVEATGPGRNVQSPCEGANKVYAFQSGLAMACLAKAGTLLNRPDLTLAAAEAMSYWERLRMAKAPCKDCVYFAMSDSDDDSERYVRNMSLFIAMGAAEIGKARGSQQLVELSRKTVASDVAERAGGNKGYLGRLDPLWAAKASEADRIENHSAGMAAVLKDIAAATGDKAIESHALTVYSDWATCNNKRCLTADCHYWAGDPKTCQATHTATHCAFRGQEKLARGQCDAFLTLAPQVSSYGLWTILQGGVK